MNLDYPLYPKQYRFVTSRKRYCGFIAGIGTGKTRAGCVKGLLKALNNPGSLGCITAPTYPMLRDATKRTFFEICPPDLIAYKNDTENIVGIVCPDGKISEILFRSTSDPDSLRGPNLLWFFMDEAAMSDREAFLILIGRLRSKPADAQQGFVCTTPKGYNWVFDMFGPAQLDFAYECIYATTRENVFLPEEFVHDVYSQFTGSFKEQELEGKFCAFEGLVYGDLWTPDKHVGLYPFNCNLPVDLAWDFGYPNPEAVLAIQQDERGNTFVIDEVYRYKTITEDVAADVKSRLWYKNVVDAVCDDARPDTIVRLTNLAIPARGANKGKILDGIKVVRSLLNNDRASGVPILHVDKRCEMLIKEMGQYRWKEKKTEAEEYQENPVDMYNHALDALRYWASAKWNSPTIVIPEDYKKPVRRKLAFQYMP